jgi:hypothetical protein
MHEKEADKNHDGHADICRHRRRERSCEKPCCPDDAVLASDVGRLRKERRSILCLGNPCCAVGRGRVSALDIEAAKKAVDFWKPTSVGRASCYVCENNPDRKAASNHTKTVFELQDVKVQVAPESLSEADKLNKVEWRGRVSLHYTAVRYYSPPDKTWSQWREAGYVEPDMDFERTDGDLKQPAKQGFTIVKGSYPNGPIGQPYGASGLVTTTIILITHPKQVESSDLPK